MAIWQVIADYIKLYPHPNADKLLLGNIGGFQVVVGKNNEYSDGDLVVFAPEKSILPEDLRPHYINTETGQSYLSGINHDRVSRIRLRNEYSEGVTIPLKYVKEKLGSIPVGVDLSELLKITKYEPPLPTSFAGQLERIDTVADFRQHDVEQFRLYSSEFRGDEFVIATEKLHGSQINILKDKNGKRFVTSKGMAGKNASILEDDKNIYWKAVRNVGLFEHLDQFYGTSDVQIFGELIPCQGANYSYGQDPNKPTLRIFRFITNGIELGFWDMTRGILFVRGFNDFIMPLFVPIIYKGPYDVDALVESSKGMEQVSGKQLHIREGIVVGPLMPRLSSEGFPLLLKILNPKYKDTGEELS